MVLFPACGGGEARPSPDTLVALTKREQNGTRFHVVWDPHAYFFGTHTIDLGAVRFIQ